MSSPSTAIKYQPPKTKPPQLSGPEQALLQRKQAKLIRTHTQLEAAIADSPHQLNALKSTLIFAQQEAGTAICIDPRGYLLTCSHCIHETESQYEADSNKSNWLLTYQGVAMQAQCIAWDGKRDLALLKIITVIHQTPDDPNPTRLPLEHVTLSPAPSKMRTPVFCIGQPGAEDLESETYRKTKYDLFEISEGRYRGLRKGCDPQDNEEIGGLMHDAWTYWGHSGAPICREDDGGLVGVHSSWDEETGMRHGVPGVAIGAFLEEWLPGEGGVVGEETVDMGTAEEVIDLTGDDD